MLRYLCIAGGLAGAFALGHLLHFTPSHPIPAGGNKEVVADPAAGETVQDGQSPEKFDAATLILPKRLPDAEGVMADPSFHAIQGHFKELTKLAPPLDETPSTSPNAPLKFPDDLSGPQLPPLPPLPEVKAKSVPELPQTPGLIQQVQARENGKTDAENMLIVPAYSGTIPPYPGTEQAIPPFAVAPGGKSIPCINSRSVTVAFDVLKTGISGIKATELYFRSAKQTEWRLLDRKKGLVRPFPTYLPGEGTYSVAVVLVSGSGMSQLVDANAVQVEVDMTPPRICALELRPFSGDGTMLQICWKAEDKNFDEKAISLAYSWDGREWLAITEEHIRNTGSFCWKLPDGVNHEVQLRLTARDRAGNEASAYMPEKLSIDRVVPQSRATGVMKAADECEELPPPRLATEEVLPLPRLATEEVSAPTLVSEETPEPLPLIVPPVTSTDSEKFGACTNPISFLVGIPVEFLLPMDNASPINDWVGQILEMSDFIGLDPDFPGQRCNLSIAEIENMLDIRPVRDLPCPTILRTDPSLLPLRDSAERFFNWCTRGELSTECVSEPAVGRSGWNLRSSNCRRVVPVVKNDLCEFVLQNTYRLTPWADETSRYLAFLRAVEPCYPSIKTFPNFSINGFFY